MHEDSDHNCRTYFCFCSAEDSVLPVHGLFAERMVVRGCTIQGVSRGTVADYPLSDLDPATSQGLESYHNPIRI